MRRVTLTRTSLPAHQAWLAYWMHTLNREPPKLARDGTMEAVLISEN